jgi:hypothetical protein
MGWLEKEAGRANRNLLVVNGILGAAAAYGIYAMTATMIENWSERGSDGWWIPMLFVGAILALAGWNINKAIQRAKKIELAPVWRNLVAYGQPPQLSAEIEQDLLASRAKHGKLTITSRWLIKRNMFGTWTSPVVDVAWVYKTVTRHRTNGIPTGKSYSAVISGRRQQSVTMNLSQKKVDALMAELLQRAPWAVFGYSAELAALWKKDHAGFVATVDERRQILSQK